MAMVLLDNQVGNHGPQDIWNRDLGVGEQLQGFLTKW